MSSDVTNDELIEILADGLLCESDRCLSRVPNACPCALVAERLKEALLKLDRYEQLLATAYQLAGLVGAPVRFLDAYALHDDVDPDSLLPVTLDELDAFKALTSKLGAPPPSTPPPLRTGRGTKQEMLEVRAALDRLQRYFDEVEARSTDIAQAEIDASGLFEDFSKGPEGRPGP